MLEKLLNEPYFDNLKEMLEAKILLYPDQLESSTHYNMMIKLLSDFKKYGKPIASRIPSKPKKETIESLPEFNTSDLEQLREEYIYQIEEEIYSKWHKMNESEFETFKYLKQERNLQVYHEFYMSLLDIKIFEEKLEEELHWTALSYRISGINQNMDAQDILEEMRLLTQISKKCERFDPRLIHELRLEMIYSISDNMYLDALKLSFKEFQKAQEALTDPNVENLFLEFQKLNSL